MAKFVTVQIPLVEISSDSDDGSSAPPPAPAPVSPPASVPGSPAASRRSCTRSPRAPRLHPTVSDDASSEAPARVPSISRRDPSPPAYRAPAPRPHPPRVPGPVPPYERPQPPVPRGYYQARMSVGPRPFHQLAPRDLPAPFPHSTYEHGESSQHADHGRRLDRLTADTMDARFSCQRLQEAQRSILDRIAVFETGMAGWRQVVDARIQAMAVGLQQAQLDYTHRTASMERVMMGVLAVVAVIALVTILPRFYPRG